MADALAAAITDLLAERNTANGSKRSEAARLHVTDLYSIQRMADTYHEVWFGRAEKDAEQRNRSEDNA